MFRRPHLAAFALLTFVTVAFSADNEFSTPTNLRVQGQVPMCLNGSSKAVPCSVSFPLPVSGSLSVGATTITPVKSSSAESNRVLKAAAGTFYGVVVTTGATAGFLQVFDATSAPADGAVTPVFCVQAPANQSVALSVADSPATFATGITAVFSSGANCFTKTASATAFFTGLAN